MTSRRSRIKGIANIPQRRKQGNEENEIKDKNPEVDLKNTPGNNIEQINLETVQSTNSVLTETLSCEEKSGSTANNDVKQGCTTNSLDLNISLQSSTSDKVTEIESSDQPVENSKLLLKKPAPNNASVIKRRFKKIPVSLNAIQRTKTQLLHNEKISKDTSQAKETEEQQSFSKTTVEEKTSSNEKLQLNNYFTSSVDESQLREESASVTNISENLSEKNIFQKPITLTNSTGNSDIEYPLPPPSPSKANRSRIKAVPRLAHRKTSFSASESEDESRKINRIRNDSICSTTSMVTESITECFSPQRPKDTIATVTAKKTGRSEQTRKLAEARREFIRRFGANKPERHRLTMMDLIFYNPDSNPMKDEEKNSLIHEQEQVENQDEPDVEENETKPVPDDDAPKSDEENAMPVPQIKIGPSGEIILDEQSLVIERKDVQRQREEMEKTQVVDADKFKTGYGIYKKHQRSKYWSHSETLRFYKALNTIGTDFMLMCELFPSRARRELKMKFKKEEKINRHLIDRALMQPCNFDFEDLKNEIEMEQKEFEELRKLKEEQKKLKDEKIKENHQKLIEKDRKRKSAEITRKPKPTQNEMVRRQIQEDMFTEVNNAPEPIQDEITKSSQEGAPNNETNKTRVKKNPSKRPRKEKLSIKSFMSDSDADESDMATQSESDEDIVISRKPTRSGRLPKLVQRYEDELASINYVMKKNKISNPPIPSNIEPGSIMIITEDGPNGEPVYKIYMVTPEQKATELNLSTDLVAKAIQLKKGMKAESIMTISANVTDDDEEEIPQENNVTIPADENVKSLKSCESDTEIVSIPENNKLRHLNSSEKVKVIATSEDCFPESDVIFNDANILLEVKSDGSCSQVNSKEVIVTTEENNVTIPADENIISLRTASKSKTTSEP